MQEEVSDYELQKVKNKAVANLIFSEINILNKAMNLAYYELLGDAAAIINEAEKYSSVTPQRVKEVAQNLFKPAHCSTLKYKAI